MTYNNVHRVAYNNVHRHIELHTIMYIEWHTIMYNNVHGVAYNNVYCKMSRRSSNNANAMYVTNNTPNFETLIRRSIYCFIVIVLLLCPYYNLYVAIK